MIPQATWRAVVDLHQRQRVAIGKKKCRWEVLRCGCTWKTGAGYSLGQWEVPPYNGRVKITMSVTLAPELAEAIKESAERQGLSLDDWIVAAAELKFRADDEAAIFEEAERKRRAAGLRELLDEYQAEFGAFTEEEMADLDRVEADARRVAEESWARRGAARS
jgi:hypothetical protein